MPQYYTMGKTFHMNTKSLVKDSMTTRFKSKKRVMTAKEKELITKFRKGLIWKDI
jgi:hypothetical protein